jgi:hypothetical protein
MPSKKKECVECSFSLKIKFRLKFFKSERFKIIFNQKQNVFDVALVHPFKP